MLYHYISTVCISCMLVEAEQQFNIICTRSIKI